MASLYVKEFQFIFEDAEGERVLLDCSDRLANKSRVSMRRLPGQSHPIIPEILLELIRKQKAEDIASAVPFGVLDILLVSRLIHSAKPVRLLEYGSGRGALSVHLAHLLGVFHEKSYLYCLSDTIELEWTERISHIEHLPILSFLACDFGNSGLQENSFDIVVLNGLTDFPQPFDVLKDAVSLVKSDGILFCYSQDTPLMESIFKLFFETREEYEFTPSCKIMVAEASQCSWQEEIVPDLAATVRKDLAKAAEISVDGSYRQEECVQMLEQIQKDLCATVKQGEAMLKIQLLAAKEQLLNHLIMDFKGGCMEDNEKGSEKAGGGIFAIAPSGE